jgi:predicted RNA-binding protein YlxR (DUF448 family)
MPNINSKAGHVPIRTCVVCKKKIDCMKLLNFFTMGDGIIFDTKKVMPYRKFYLCDTTECKSGLAKWMKRFQRRQQKTVR